jgi:hypothetical protein
MKKQLFWTILIFLTISIVNGQTILKKIEVTTRLDQVSTNIQNNEFEKAMEIFYNTQKVISEKNVKKGDFDKYFEIKATLEQKKNEFDRNKGKVNTYLKHNKSEYYCSAIGLLDLRLNNKNSF